MVQSQGGGVALLGCLSAGVRLEPLGREGLARVNALVAVAADSDGAQQEGARQPAADHLHLAPPIHKSIGVSDRFQNQ